MALVFCESPIRFKNPNIWSGIKKPMIEVPCGHCILCRLKMRKEWTLRLRLESSMHKDNVFVTLTYNEDTVPPEVNVRDVQLFVKRLRKNSKLKFRYYSVAEYGSHTERPHFHIILFGFPLKKIEYIKKCWTNGFITVSPLTPDRCNYTCGYTQKKYDKRMDKSLFALYPHLTFQERKELFLNCSDLLEKTYHKKIDPRRAEFSTCSLGIGLGYLEKNYKDITTKFYINYGGKNYSIPRYFRKKINEKDPDWSTRFKAYIEDYACKRLSSFINKGLDVDISFESLYDEDMLLEDMYKEYVAFRANNIKKKRALFVKIKNNIKEI